MGKNVRFKKGDTVVTNHVLYGITPGKPYLVQNEFPSFKVSSLQEENQSTQTLITLINDLGQHWMCDEDHFDIVEKPT